MAGRQANGVTGRSVKKLAAVNPGNAQGLDIESFTKRKRIQAHNDHFKSAAGVHCERVHYTRLNVAGGTASSASCRPARTVSIKSICRRPEFVKDSSLTGTAACSIGAARKRCVSGALAWFRKLAGSG